MNEPGRRLFRRFLHSRWPLAVVLAASLLVGGCQSSSANRPNEPAPVLVFAAASTADALDAVLSDYRIEHASADIKTSYGGSSILAQQIAGGAKAQLFLSADEDWVKFLADKRLVAKSRILLSNTLVLVIPTGSELTIGSLEDLAGERVKKIALADPTSVPAGKYAKKALETAHVWEQVQPKVVSGNDVRRALTFVESGAADAGIVYRTDAYLSHRVKIVAEIPEAISGPIRYALALLKQGETSAESVSFYDYLASPEAAAAFERFGFSASEKLNVAAMHDPSPP